MGNRGHGCKGAPFFVTFYLLIITLPCRLPLPFLWDHPRNLTPPRSPTTSKPPTGPTRISDTPLRVCFWCLGALIVAPLPSNTRNRAPPPPPSLETRDGVVIALATATCPFSKS